MIKECREVLSQFLRDDIFSNLLLDDIIGILVNLDNTIDLSIDVITEHVLNSHG